MVTTMKRNFTEIANVIVLWVIAIAGASAMGYTLFMALRDFISI